VTTACGSLREADFGVVETFPVLLGKAGFHSWISFSCSVSIPGIYHRYGPNVCLANAHIPDIKIYLFFQVFQNLSAFSLDQI
jgi:hypothetical protein